MITEIQLFIKALESYPHIKGALYRYLENTGNLSLTKDQSEALRKMQALYAEGYAIEDIATKLGISKNITVELIRYNTHQISARS